MQRRGAAPGRRCRSVQRFPLVAVVLTAVAAPLALALAAAAGEPRATGLAVTVRAPGGALLAEVPLPDRTFAVRYRNSVYHSLAEERYEVQPDGRFEVVQLAADEVAVLEEYYAVPSRPRRAPDSDRRDYLAPPDPARPPVFVVLYIAATDLGERTLLVPGQPSVALWRLVEEDPTVILQIEETS